MTWPKGGGYIVPNRRGPERTPKGIKDDNSYGFPFYPTDMALRGLKNGIMDDNSYGLIYEQIVIIFFCPLN